MILKQDDDNQIAAFGFGDKQSTSKSAFPFYTNRKEKLFFFFAGSKFNLHAKGFCEGFQEVLTRYTELVPTLTFSGPTSFAPLIHTAIKQVSHTGGGYHILIIICDGEITPDTEWLQCTSETKRALVEASNYALSIIVVGVGDGPWDSMEEFDDELPDRKFDNFHFVDFHKTVTTGPQQYLDVNFSCKPFVFSYFFNFISNPHFPR